MPVKKDLDRLASDIIGIPEKESEGRIHFLDNLKIFLAIIVVLHHAAQPYGSGISWWIPQDPYNFVDFVVLGLFMALNVSFFMGLFFMISAYFLPSSLQKKGPAIFMRDRLVKFGVPFLIIAGGIYPLMAILIFGHLAINMGNLWFLELLLLFSAVYVIYWLIKKPSLMKKKEFPNTVKILAFTVVMAFISFIVRIWAPEYYWTPFSLMEPFHITQYVMLFIAGIIAFREGWIDAIPQTTGKLWSGVAMFFVITLPVIVIVTQDTQFSGGLTLASLIGSIWEAFMGVSICIALLAFFKKRFNSDNPVTKAFARDTFTVYLIHIPIVVFLQYTLIGIAVDSLIKFMIVGSIGVLLSFAFSHVIIRRMPYAKYIIG